MTYTCTKHMYQHTYIHMYLLSSPPRMDALRDSGWDSLRLISSTVTRYFGVALRRERRPGTWQNTSALGPSTSLPAESLKGSGLRPAGENSCKERGVVGSVHLLCGVYVRMHMCTSTCKFTCTAQSYPSYMWMYFALISFYMSRVWSLQRSTYVRISSCVSYLSKAIQESVSSTLQTSYHALPTNIDPSQPKDIQMAIFQLWTSEVQKSLLMKVAVKTLGTAYQMIMSYKRLTSKCLHT